jgi:hypothetical protein
MTVQTCLGSVLKLVAFHPQGSTVGQTRYADVISFASGHVHIHLGPQVRDMNIVMFLRNIVTTAG